MYIQPLNFSITLPYKEFEWVTFDLDKLLTQKAVNSNAKSFAEFREKRNFDFVLLKSMFEALNKYDCYENTVNHIKRIFEDKIKESNL